jgi:hypothetical protein
VLHVAPRDIDVHGWLQCVTIHCRPMTRMLMVRVLARSGGPLNRHLLLLSGGDSCICLLRMGYNTIWSDHRPRSGGHEESSVPRIECARRRSTWLGQTHMLLVEVYRVRTSYAIRYLTMRLRVLALDVLLVTSTLRVDEL